MSQRELIVLGTASQAPTRHRNHNGYVVRWDDRLLLFDPGEGTQRQFTLAGVAAARLTDICVTHFHGDHCLGLPGIIQRLCGDKVEREVPIYYPGDGEHFFERLRYASAYEPVTPIVQVPLTSDGPAGSLGRSTLIVGKLDHRITSYGYRVQEPDGRRLDADKLAAAGVQGPAVGELVRDGVVEIDDTVLRVEDFSEERRGQSLAFIMDTRWCDGALALAEGVDLLVCESTFLESEAHLAKKYAHMTARQAGRLARLANARHLVLTHFSARYPDVSAFVEEAKLEFDSVEAVVDFDRVAVPPR